MKKWKEKKKKIIKQKYNIKSKWIAPTQHIKQKNFETCETCETKTRTQRLAQIKQRINETTK
jgi:hypothetical protein